MSGAGAGITELKGAEAKVIPIRDIAPAAIQPYKTLALGQVTTDVAPIVTPECISGVRNAMQEQFADEDVKEHFPGGGKRLVVDVVCRFFKEQRFLGGDPRLDLLVTLTDGESKEVVGKYYVAGVSEAKLSGKLEHLAKENAKELWELLEDRKRVRRRTDG